MAFRIILCFCFFLFPSLSSSSSPPLCNSHDYSALHQFINAFSLNSHASAYCDEFHQLSYPKTASWGNVSNCCLWDGVTCDSMSGHVIGLDLSCSWLYGQLHSYSTLFQLSHLQTLNLAYNDFNGSLISSQFGDLPTLTHLNLSESVFVGEVPLKISQLSKLVSLDLSRSDLILIEPSTWKKLILNITDLRELVLDYVDMSSITPGSLSLLMNLSSSLVSLSLKDTQLQGKLPNNIFYLQNLQKLDLSGNGNLMGQLPKSNWSSPLSLLYLSEIAFRGQMPDSIGHLKSLNFLSLSNCQFGGHIPSSFKNLTQLTYLDVSSNNFSGELSFLSNLQSLTSLNLNNNGFSGQIPSSLSNLEHLTYLDLSVNYFTSEIPDVFGNLRKLKHLSLSQNNIEGQLPWSLCNLAQLTDLDCSYNKLIFPIGCKLTNLEFLDLSNNKLQGDFPESIFSLTGLSSLRLSLNNLSGFVNFHQFSKLQNLEELDLSSHNYLSLNFDNNLDYTIPNLQSLQLSSCHTNSFPKFSSLPSTLQGLDLFDNKLQGLPDESIFGLVNLSSLFLSSNNLSGLINFHQFSKLQDLQELDLSNNKFLSLSFDNKVVYNMTNLEHLDLSSCNINSFPKLPMHLPNLHYLNLSNNNMHGMIPEWLNNATNGLLMYLDLSQNMLQGNLQIPPFGVRYFLVSNNKLSGDIPSMFCNGSSLEILDLSHINLLGFIPKCLVAFPNLLTLDLQMNNFVGTIPNNFSKSNSLQSLHLNNNQFEGLLPLSLAHCKQLEILDVGGNKIEDAFPSWLEGLPELQVLILQDTPSGPIYRAQITVSPGLRKTGKIS